MPNSTSRMSAPPTTQYQGVTLVWASAASTSAPVAAFRPNQAMLTNVKSAESENEPVRP
jgi:hypothetical protein